MKLEARIDRMVQKGNVKAIASVSMDGIANKWIETFSAIE